MATLSSLSSTSTFLLEPNLQKLPSAAHLLQQKASSFQRGPVNNQLVAASEQKLSYGLWEAISLIRKGVKFEPQFYPPLLQHCLDVKSVSEAEIIHGHMIKTRNYEDTFLMTTLLNVYAKCGDMENARKVFDDLPKRNDIAWSMLMTGYIQSSKPEVAVEVFRELLESSSLPSTFNLAIALNACYSLNSLDLGSQFHAFIIKYRMEHDTSVGSTLCKFYSRSGNLNSSIKAFQSIEDKDVISWSSVITACDNNGDVASGLRFFAEMREADVEPNEFTFTAVLSMCTAVLDLDLGSQVHSLVVKLGFWSTLNIVILIMNLYRKSGWIDEAQNLFNKLESVSLVTWSAVIAGYAESVNVAKYELLAHRCGIEALRNYLNLRRLGLKPNQYTLSSIFTVCGKLLASEQGEQIHAQTIKSGFLSNVVVGTALVTMYNKCGSIEEASKAFLEMSSRTVVSWTTMISSFAQLGRSQQALQLFEDMRLAGVKPNHLTFMGALAACSHAGMVDEALSYFQMMQNQYRIRPIMGHYGFMVDLYVRLGKLDEAYKVIQKMDFLPNKFIILLLISGCKHQANDEVRFDVAEKLLELKPKDFQDKSVLLNMYRDAERWEDVSRLEELMKQEKVERREEDWSWISIKDKVRSFKTGIQSAPENIETTRLLEELLVKAKSHGYESEQASEASDEVIMVEENNMGCCASAGHHSEKLAVTFGLLSTQTGSPLRVSKTSTMCRDCHNFLKIVSLMSNREIIVKDRWLIHKFSNGLCSCAEFPGLL
ncbi:Pentatricopeptide repeat-containing protein At1g11290, chloroplastic [Linum perenne]